MSEETARPDRYRAPLEALYVFATKALPKSHRLAYGGDAMMAQQYRGAYHLFCRGLSWSLYRLWLRVLLPQLLVDVGKQRVAQVASARLLLTPPRLVKVGGLASVAVGVMGMLASLVMAADGLPDTFPFIGARGYAQVAAIPFPSELPLGLGYQMYTDVLAAAGCVGLYLLVRGRSLLAVAGLACSTASVLFSVAATAYERSTALSYMRSQGTTIVNNMDTTMAILLWSQALLSLLGLLLLSVCFLRSSLLGRTRMLPLVLSFAQLVGCLYAFVETLGVGFVFQNAVVGFLWIVLGSAMRNRAALDLDQPEVAPPGPTGSDAN